MSNFITKHLKKTLAISLATILVVCFAFLSGSVFTAKANAVSVSYKCHIQSTGWTDWVVGDDQCGTTGQSLRMEAVQIRLDNAPVGMGVTYRAHVQNIGWQSWVTDGVTAGTTGQALRMEALEVELTGSHPGLDIQYRAHVQSDGWQEYVTGPAMAGTTGQSLRIEAINIKLVPDALQLTIADPTTLTLSKEYDGDNTATVTAGALSGLVTGSDSVTVSAVATYDSADVETGKTINVVYTLDGDDADNYIAPVDYHVHTGVITAINATDAVVALEDATTALDLTETKLVAAEALVAPANTAVGLISDGTTKTDLENRITTANGTVTTARTAFDGLVTTANTAVGLLETAAGLGLTVEGNLTAAEALVTPANTAVGLVGAGTTKTALALRVTNATGTVTVARTAFDLAAAKVAAKADVATALEGYNGDNYSGPNWITLNNFHTDGDTAIDGAANTGAVATAKTAAIDGMAGVLTVEGTETAAEAAVVTAETTSTQGNVNAAQTLVDVLPGGSFKTSLQNRIDAVQVIVTLAATKAAAVINLAAYKSSADYRSAEQTALATAISDGNDAINGAADTAGVATALANAKGVIDAIKTDAQLTAEELAAAKSAAVTELSTYVDSDDYRSAEQTALTNAITAGNTAINGSANTGAVATALSDAKLVINAIKTDAQLTAEGLVATKAAAVINLAAYKSSADYRSAEQTALATAISDGNDAINGATDTDAVATALASAKLVINAIKTDAQLTAEGLVATKAAAVINLAAYKTSGDYRVAGQTALATAISDGNDAINGATDTAGVATALANAKGVIDLIKTDAQLTAEELVAAKVAAKADVATALAGYNGGNYSGPNWITLNNFHTNGDIAIDAATDLTGVSAAKTAAINGMAGVLTIGGVETAAIAAVVTAEATPTQGNVNAAQTLVTALPNGSFKTSLQNRINAVQAIVTATAAVVTAEGTPTQGNINAAQTLVTALPAGATKDALNARIAAVQVIVTLAAYKVTKLGELAGAFASYSAYQADYTEGNWTILTGFDTDGIAAINGAADLAAVDSALSTATVGMAGVHTIITVGYGAPDYDFATIQSAVNAADSGDTISVAAGTYAENVQIFSKNGLTIQGVGDGTLIAGTGYGFEIDNSDNTTIKDLKIITNGPGLHGIYVDGNWVGSGRGLSHSDNLTIQNTTISATGGTGTEATGIYADYATNGAHTGWNITGNRITADGGGIGLEDVTNSTVSNNVSTIADGTNILWLAVKSDLANLVVSDNTVNGSGGSQVSFLTDYHTGSDGKTISGVTVSGNTFDTWGSRGLRIGTGVSGVIVSQNKFLKTGEALKNENASTVNAERNYWGEAIPNFATKIITTGGAVDYDPWYIDAEKTTLSS